MVKLTNEELKRYSRHLIIPELGIKGQQKLKDSSVLIIGAGGLGCPLSIYLAAAGVGTIGLVDFDTIEYSNLHRQILYSEQDVGKYKAEIAKKRIFDVNPHVKVNVYPTAFTSENAIEISSNYDILIDGTDNFPTRYLVNDVAVLTKKANVFGSIFRFDGQITVFDSQQGPCYRCLYPKPPDPGMVPNCAEGGVLGILPGIIGVMQATEAIKIITDLGEPLIGRLTTFDALQMGFRTMKIRKDINCPICSEKPTITELIDYQEFCGIKPTLQKEESINTEDLEITPTQLQKVLIDSSDLFLLDVREPHELEISIIEGSYPIPLGQVLDRITEVPKDKQIITICRSGGRSMKALEILKEHGYSTLLNLKGGINQWADEVDSSLPIY